MNEERDVHLYRNWIGFFILGTINNLPYVVINSSAKVLASSFQKDNLVTLVMFANVAFGFISKSTNTLISLTKCPFWIRFVINGCFMLIGLVGVAFAPNFWIALVAIVFAGTSSSFGENLTLGYLQLFPKECINAWSSGTGMAGLFGAILYIALSCIAQVVFVQEGNPYAYFNPQSPSYINEVKSINKFAFIGTLPVVLLYWISYFFVIKSPPIHSSPLSSSSSSDNVTPLINDKNYSTQESDIDKNESTEGTLQRIFRCIKITLWLAINLALVYIFEYICRGFAAKSRPQMEYYISELHCPELYASIQLCYQAGVFVSRSSVQLFQFKRVEILSILQFINLLVWFTQVWWKYMPVYILPGFMVYVGLIGGASYVNTMYLLRTDKKFPDKDRELCINIIGIWMNIGILLGTSIPIPLYSTILKDK